ncbi:MAG: hypothetical protein HY866_07935 [Chloroflexi bacterium]|nr:hypothetical protein [Chloroflexota bacterium]
MSSFSLSIFNHQRERQIQDLLMTHAEALISGTLNLDHLLASLDQEARHQVADLFSLAERVSSALIEVDPSEKFVASLRQELALADAAMLQHDSIWQWIRHLPPRTQIAAGIGGATLTAGMVLIASRTLPEVWSYWRSRKIPA